MNKKSYLTLVWERGINDTKDYYRNDRRAWVYNVGSAIVVAIITPIVSYLLGQITIPSQLGISILVGVIAGAIVFIVWLFGVFIYHIWESPRNLYNDREQEIGKILKEKDSELERFNWNKVDFYVTPYSIIGMKGWGLKIKNDKRFDLYQIILQITKIRINRKFIPLLSSKMYLLGFIDRRNGQVEEKIVYSYKRGGIERGKEKDFVITEIAEGSPMQGRTYSFVTYPDTDLEWPFEKTNDFLTRSVLSPSITSDIISASMALQKTPEPTVVIEVVVKAAIKIEDEENALPIEILKLQVHSDGSLSFYGEDDDDDDNP